MTKSIAVTYFGIPVSSFLRDSSLVLRHCSSTLLQQLANQLHSLSLFWTRAQLRHAALHSADPARARCGAGDIEAIFARESIRDHHDREPRFTFEKRVHQRGIKIALELNSTVRASKTAERCNFLQF